MAEAVAEREIGFPLEICVWVRVCVHSIFQSKPHNHGTIPRRCDGGGAAGWTTSRRGVCVCVLLGMEARGFGHAKQVLYH